MPALFWLRRVATLSLAAIAMLVAAGASLAQELSIGNVNPPKHGTSLAAQQFIDKLAELTGGKIKVAHHHSGALGGEREVAQQIQLGAVDFGPITTAPLSTLIPEMSVFQLPYIFRDYDHVFKALDGSDTITKYYDGVLDKKGLKLIGFIAAGYRGIYGHGAINSLADVKGKKVRVQEDKILVATFKALGMISTPDRLPGGGDRAADQGDRFRRGRRQHVLPQQVLRHRQVRRRRAPHASGGRARSCRRPPGRSRMRRARRPSPTPGRMRARSTASSSSTRTSRSRTRCASQGRHHHQARRDAVPAGDAERLRGVLRHACRQGRARRWSTSS